MDEQELIEFLNQPSETPPSASEQVFDWPQKGHDAKYGGGFYFEKPRLPANITYAGGTEPSFWGDLRSEIVFEGTKVSRALHLDQMPWPALIETITIAAAFYLLFARLKSGPRRG
ncbi:hypothetical protein [Jiella avicenniae]|uniref:Uncharacterized protein n=1 Tax=Jiella avicenniae TaxID=2907202 RepID=A0A9X1NXY8_9HYPH|nr:hypothetical protein [Jiella avicenniae]MCE7026431.1 hypothetical protein [Jiella avicenniae]